MKTPALVCDPFFQRYINRVDDELNTFLQKQCDEISDFIKEIKPDKESYRYASDKWTIKEVIGHCVDTERIMGFRALSISRGEKANLNGFDENNYVVNGKFDERSLNSLREEFSYLRKSHILLKQAMSDEQLGIVGQANGAEVSVQAIWYVLAGHWAHHLQIIKERYL